MPGVRKAVVMSEAEVDAFLESSLTGVLTTLDKGGWPHSTAMWFVIDRSEHRLRMWTYAKSQKAVNLRRDRRCSFLAETGTQYLELQGVLVRAEAEILDDFYDVTRVGVDLYRRYVGTEGEGPEGAALEEIERQARKRIGVIVGLSRVASWDHTKLMSSPYGDGRQQKEAT
jgi:general stress protein 26